MVEPKLEGGTVYAAPSFSLKKVNFLMKLNTFLSLFYSTLLSQRVSKHALKAVHFQWGGGALTLNGGTNMFGSLIPFHASPTVL